MSDLQTYLASKYMTGAKADAIIERSAGEKRKKKKRKVQDDVSSVASTSTKPVGGSGLIIEDDDGMGWARKKDEDDEDESRPVVEQQRGIFKAKSGPSSSWSTIRESSSNKPDPEHEYIPSPSPEPVDEEPVVVAATRDVEPARGGLQSATQLRAEQARRDAEILSKKRQAEEELEARKKELRERGEELNDDDDDGLVDPTATVYRDASGKKVDMKLAKAEKAKQKRDEMEKQIKKMEWGKGLVQRGEKEARAKERQEMLSRPLARYADDKDMNEEMKDQDRWNDPAANFLTKKKKEKIAGPKYPKYTGPMPAPNRFGIPPGYRWDGVDRSNGFEAQYMQKINARKMRSAEAHAYSTEDM